MATAQQIPDSEQHEESQTSEVLRRSFQVLNVESVAEALLAANMPQYGDPDIDRPDLTVIARRSISKTVGTGGLGSRLMNVITEVSWGTPSNGSIPLNQQFVEFNSAGIQKRIEKDLDGQPIGFAQYTRNASGAIEYLYDAYLEGISIGADILIPTLLADVVLPVGSASDAYNPTLLASMIGTCNASPFTITDNRGTARTFAAGFVLLTAAASRAYQTNPARNRTFYQFQIASAQLPPGLPKFAWNGSAWTPSGVTDLGVQRTFHTLFAPKDRSGVFDQVDSQFRVMRDKATPFPWAVRLNRIYETSNFGVLGVT